MEVYGDVHHQISSPPTDMPSPSSVASTPSPDATVPHPSADASKAGGRRWRPGKTKPPPAEFETPSLNASSSSGFGARKKQNTSRHSRPNDQSQLSSSVLPRSPSLLQDASLVDDDEVKGNLNGSILVDGTTNTTTNKTNSSGRVDGNVPCEQLLTAHQPAALAEHLKRLAHRTLRGMTSHHLRPWLPPRW